MKPGDLVIFRTGVQAWSLDYENRSPGIICWVNYNDHSPYSLPSARVFWKNGESTTEHLSYLELIGQENENR